MNVTKTLKDERRIVLRDAQERGTGERVGGWEWERTFNPSGETSTRARKMKYNLTNTLIFKCRLRGCQPSDGNTEWGAADIVEAYTMKELHGAWVTTMFATDAKL